MDHSTHNKIVSFIWSIADDCLRDIFVRGKYRDVILPMFVLRRLDVLLEPSKEDVLEEVRFQREEAKFTEMEPQGLCDVSGYVFYNTSLFTLKSLLGNPSQLEANFKNYLDGFSDNVKEIIKHFDLRSQIDKMAAVDVLHEVIDKFVSEEINLSPEPAQAPDGRKLPELSNLGMGYVFEELIRKFNEDNNEEAGEHFTPREVIDLMTHILFEPVKQQLPPVITIYDPACGSGGMLTESQNFIIDPEGEIKSTADVYLFGKEINGETYAICKSDMMIKGNNPENIRFGSTLQENEFADKRFDFMLSNPPYGKSWKTEQKHILDGKDVFDPRFQVGLRSFNAANEDNLADDKMNEPAIPRSSDGQLLFLMEMASKIKSLSQSPNGSRIASVHNGSSLFTGDAGSGESNIRRYLIENDLLEAIIQLPNNLFYNTGITTYIWVLSNNKMSERQSKVQLIDASNLYQKLRKNLGQKNCEFSPEHIKQITNDYLTLKQTENCKVFDNADFGYYKVTVERPLRLKAQFTEERVASLRFVEAIREEMAWVYEKYGDAIYSKLNSHKKAIEDYLELEEISLTPKNKNALFNQNTWLVQQGLMQVAEQLMAAIGTEEFNDFNVFREKVSAAVKAANFKSPAKPDKKLQVSELKQILNAVSWRDEAAEKVIKKTHKVADQEQTELCQKLGTTTKYLADYGYWSTEQAEQFIEYETDSELRDSENIPLKDDIHGYFIREVRPHVADAWLNIEQTKIGYEVSFNKYFYQHQPLRSLPEVITDILALESETEGLLKKLVNLTVEDI